MPLDTSLYAISALRLDGRRWNELRHISASISTQAAADGSSYLEMGNTKVLCTVTGPAEGAGGRSGRSEQSADAKVDVEISVASFSGTDRRRRGRSDKRTTELAHALSAAFTTHLFTHLYPHSTISITLHVLSADGSLLAALFNASTLALIDAGVPMPDLLAACTAGSTASYASNDEEADPLLDLNSLEETELPFLTVATADKDGRVAALLMETRVQSARLEGMVAVAVDGCGEVRKVLERVVRAHGKAVLQRRVAG